MRKGKGQDLGVVRIRSTLDTRLGHSTAEQHASPLRDGQTEGYIEGCKRRRKKNKAKVKEWVKHAL